MSEESDTQSLAERLPDLEARIQALMMFDPDLAQMIQEYEEVARTLDFWIRLSALPEKHIENQVRDNRDLLEELVAEIELAVEQTKCISPETTEDR